MDSLFPALTQFFNDFVVAPDFGPTVTFFDHFITVTVG